VLDDKTPLTISRQLLQEFAKQLPSLPAALHKEIGYFSLEKIQTRALAFEEQISIVRTNLADILEDEEEWKDAAKMLIGIPLESSQR
jgi:COP9 signalosome complex subunit 4